MLSRVCRKHAGLLLSRRLYAAHKKTSAERSRDDEAQELYHKGTKKMMESDDGKDCLQYASHAIDETTERIIEAAAEDSNNEKQVKRYTNGCTAIDLLHVFNFMTFII